jgi:hypothetical protein
VGQNGEAAYNFYALEVESFQNLCHPKPSEILEQYFFDEPIGQSQRQGLEIKLLITSNIITYVY